jgi:hypothetical protein
VSYALIGVASRASEVELFKRVAPQMVGGFNSLADTPATRMGRPQSRPDTGCYATVTV